MEVREGDVLRVVVLAIERRLGSTIECSGSISFGSFWGLPSWIGGIRVLSATRLDKERLRGKELLPADPLVDEDTELRLTMGILGWFFGVKTSMS